MDNAFVRGKYDVVHGSWDRQDNAVYDQDGKIVLTAGDLFSLGVSTVDLIFRYPMADELDRWVTSVLTKRENENDL